MSDESPSFRIAVGTDPNNPSANPNQVDYQHVKLRWAAGHNGSASEKAGRPVYDKVLVLTHIYPGSPDQLDVEVKRYPEEGEPIVVDPARAGRFAEIIGQFELRGSAAATGTPLAAINLDPAQVANLRGIGIATVEALSDVPDSALGRLGMGARALRDRALAFAKASAGNAPMAALQAVNETLVSDMAELRRLMAEQAAEQKSMAAELRADARKAPPAPEAPVPEAPLVDVKPGRQRAEKAASE